MCQEPRLTKLLLVTASLVVSQGSYTVGQAQSIHAG
jgi:hypothetical protein